MPLLFHGVSAIAASDLTKVYRGGVVGVDGLDLAVEPGEVVGIVGPNGSGKTTTIRLLLDLLRPTRGSASILGLDVRTDSLAVRRRVGFLPGDLVFHGSLSGREVLALSTRLRPGSGAPLRDDLLRRVALDPAALSRRVRAYSTGMRRKLGLVVALQHDPEVAILDEPTTGLDPLVRRRYHDAIRTWRGDGRTLLLCTHDMLEVEALCDRILVLREGRLAASLSLADLRERTEGARSLEDLILSYYEAP